MTTWYCRLYKYFDDGKTTNTSFRQFNIEAINSFNSRNQVKIFHPIMIRSIGQFLDIGAIAGEQGKLTATTWPSLVVDFGQWDETIDIDCFYAVGNNEDVTDIIEDYTMLRRWIMEGQGTFQNEFYLKLYTSSTGDSTAFDAKGIPFGVLFEKSGFPGMVTEMSMHKWPAGEDQIKFNLKFRVCKVVPV